MLETDALKEKLEMEIHRFARPPEELSSGDPYFEQLQTMLAIRDELENIPLCDIQRDMLLAMENGQPIGFAQCSLRHDYVEGTSSSPVGYLEGIFVREEYRRRGYGTELLRACEAWAANRGCREFASDCELDNADSFRFHMAAGFLEANRVICFVKELK